MTRHRLAIVLTTLLCIIWFSAWGVSESIRRKRRGHRPVPAVTAVPVPVPKLAIPGHNPTPVFPAEPHYRSPEERLRALSLQVAVHPGLKGSAARMAAEAAQRISAARPLPDHRLAHFHYMIGDARYKILAWGGLVEGVERASGGWLVTVRVGPSLTYRGRAATGADYVLEQYLISGDQVQYLRSEDGPPELVGEPVVG